MHVPPTFKRHMTDHQLMAQLCWGKELFNTSHFNPNNSTRPDNRTACIELIQRSKFHSHILNMGKTREF